MSTSVSGRRYIREDVNNAAAGIEKRALVRARLYDFFELVRRPM